MAEELHDGDFWLPSHFLTDHDILMDCQTATNTSSPVESVLGSTETESDEDEFVSGLTRKLARSSIQHPNSDKSNSKTWGMDGSPQSTLTSLLGGSSRGSTNCSSQVSSPPSNRPDVSWDLLYAAAGEVAKMRRYEEMGGYSAPVKNPNPNGFNPSGSDPIHQYQSTHRPSSNWGQYQQNQPYKMVQNRGPNGVRPAGLSPSVWPTLQQSQQPRGGGGGSGMRAVFLGIPGGAKRESTGTGVFIPNTPRRTGVTPAVSRKKQGCSTVLLPERVVQALNLKLEPVSSSVIDPSLKSWKNVPAVGQQRLNVRWPEPAVMNEIRLPKEWTY